MAKQFVLIILSAMFLLSYGCAGQSMDDSRLDGGDTLTHDASLLTIVDFKDYRIADVANPWNDGKRLQRYILIDRSRPIPADLPDGVIVKTPLQSSLVYSSVHAGAIKELGAIKAVTAVCDAQYYKIPEIIAGLGDGSVKDAGSSMSPSVEKIIEHEPEAILASPFQNAGHGAIEQLGMPIIECADYMEPSPLGRAEWIKLLGELYGNRHAADCIYAAVSDNYNRYRSATDSIADRRKIISEMVTSGVWYLPGGNSYMAHIFADAGADYPWKDDRSAGSLQLDFATVYDRAHDADFWFIRTLHDVTLDNLESAYPLHARIKAFVSGGVYACNTAASTIYEDTSFHPDMLLRDFINIMYPGLLPDRTVLYFSQVR